MFVFFGFTILIFSLLILVVMGSDSASNLDGGRSSFCQVRISYYFYLNSIMFIFGV